jgi:hypothetical protein
LSNVIHLVNPAGSREIDPQRQGTAGERVVGEHSGGLIEQVLNRELKTGDN